MITNMDLKSNSNRLFKEKCKIHFSKVSSEVIQTLKFLGYDTNNFEPYIQSIFIFAKDITCSMYLSEELKL